VEALGIESGDTSAPIVADRRENDAKDATRGDAKRRGVSASDDVVEVALARAIDAEVDERSPSWEGRVFVLARELQARRLARASVVVLADRGGSSLAGANERGSRTPGSRANNRR
jgi:hypothetical protein